MPWFLIVLLLAAPLTTWGFSAERTESYIQQARSLQIWEDPQWLRLGHYRKSWGRYQSAIEGDFFLSSRGSQDPKDELLQTLKVLFSPSNSAKHPQCRYRARTLWLKSRLNIASDDILACHEQSEWKKILNAEELYIVFASSDLTSAGSSFGHTFLRAHNPKNTKERELLDYGINYAALTGQDNGALFALKGLFGFYPGAYSMLPYYQKIREYTNLEGRSLWEYKLKLTPAQVDFLIDHLLELEGSYSPYYFLTDNCSQQILELIEVAVPERDLTSSFRDATIPLDTLKVLRDQWLLEGERARPSLQAYWQAHYRNLNAAEKQVVRDLVHAGHSRELQKLPSAPQASALEATLSYLAVKEYRDQKEYKDLKYQLSVQRAKLGNVTEPVVLGTPKSPLLSPDSQAYYLSVGSLDEKNFVSFKYRRAFHDLLSDDSGLSPFSHLEVLGVEFRYETAAERLDLDQLTLLKIFNSPPVTEFESPWTWRLDLGTQPKLDPYLRWAVGYSLDLPLKNFSRASLLLVNDNFHLGSIPHPLVGVEALFMSKWNSGLRSVISARILQNTRTGEGLGVGSAGVSWGGRSLEYRFETELYNRVPLVKASVIF
nr:DUF4105 domain-containing protein [Bdellovibrio sp. HAGR004]